MQILTFTTQRGGTGKTTSAVAIAQAAALDGKKVLAIDLDPQENLTYTLNADPMQGGSSYELLTGTPARKLIQKPEGSIDVIPADWSLSTIESGTGSARRLQIALKPILGRYDYIIIDTPATAGELQYNALQAATGLIIPIQADIYGLQSLYQISAAAEQFKLSNPELSVKGIVFTRHNGRSILAKQMKEEIIDAANEMGIPYLADIRAGVVIQEAQALRANLFKYAPKSKPAQDYKSLYDLLKE